MNERREFNAHSVEEAVERAAASLKIAQSSLSYNVLDEGSSGFLGLGARDARIVVEVSEEEPLASQDPTLEQDIPTPPTSTEGQGEAYHHEGPSLAPEETSQLEAEERQEKASQELLAEIRERVETTLSSMAFDGKVSVQDEEEVIVVNIESEDAGLLIGRKGETIDALQYLINISIYHNKKFSKKVVLDCGGYRDHREKAVQGMAHRTAKRVAKKGKAVDLPPMSSSERRAVHAYLKEDPRVTTASTGNDETRRVTISPAR